MKTFISREAGVTFPPEASTVISPVKSLPLLDRSAVCDLLGVCPATASKVMKESGRSIRIHSRIYILRDSLFDYLRECERRGGGNRA